MAIRCAVRADGGAIAELTTQLGYDVDPASVPGRLVRLLSRDDQALVVAELNGLLIGWIHVGITESIMGAFAMVGGLVVDRARRNQGVGSALLARAEQWAADNGCVIMRIRSSAARTAAHDFYEHRGYANIKTQYTFVKPIRPGGVEAIRGFVPRVDP